MFSGYVIVLSTMMTLLSINNIDVEYNDEAL